MCGEWLQGESLLSEHAKRWATRAKRNPDLDARLGYGVLHTGALDTMFAIILKRIGWEGTYAHAWPATDRKAVVVTTREPDAFLSVTE